jgi:transcription initiation factor TFIIIB Brf1 subunit/transcription initiation factor TFIIB
LMSPEQRSGERVEAVQRVLREQEDRIDQLGLGPDTQAQVRDALSKTRDALETAAGAPDEAAAAAIQTASNLLSFTLTALDTSGPPARPPEPGSTE